MGAARIGVKERAIQREKLRRRVAKAFKDNPGRSVRAVSVELGLPESTVRRWRDEGSDLMAVGRPKGRGAVIEETDQTDIRRWILYPKVRSEKKTERIKYGEYFPSLDGEWWSSDDFQMLLQSAFGVEATEKVTRCFLEQGKIRGVLANYLCPPEEYIKRAQAYVRSKLGESWKLVCLDYGTSDAYIDLQRSKGTDCLFFHILRARCARLPDRYWTTSLAPRWDRLMKLLLSLKRAIGGNIVLVTALPAFHRYSPPPGSGIRLICPP